MKRILSIIIALLILCSLALTSCVSEEQPHSCESKCEKCQLCTDKNCTEAACADKCKGHDSDVESTDDDSDGSHTCESECPTCGKCTDMSCTESACADKCAGHSVIENESAKEFISNTSDYLSEANDGIAAAVAALGGNVELTYVAPVLPMPTVMSARTPSYGILAGNRYASGGSIVMLSDDEKDTMMCAKCGEVEVPVSQKYCDDCKKAMEDQPPMPQKQYTNVSDLESYIIFNSISRKIKLIIGETEYYTEADFPFPYEWELELIGTVKFEGEFTRLLKEIADYELDADAEGFYILETPNYADGTLNPDTGEIDKELGGQTLTSKWVKGYKYSGKTLTTFNYGVSYDILSGEESVGNTVYTEYTLDGDNFYYEKYEIDESGEKNVIDMFDIVKPAEEQNEIDTVHYVQMTLSLEEITGAPAVYFEEAMDIAEQWDRYINEKMSADMRSEIPTKVYANTRIRSFDNFVEYQTYYFRDFDYATMGYENGESAPFPASWREGFDGVSGEKFEAMIDETLRLEYGEGFVCVAGGQIERPSRELKYSPFRLKESEVTLDVNSTGYRIIASEAEDVPVTFTSLNEDIVTVDSSGLITTYGVENNAVIMVQRGKLVRYFYVYVRAELVAPDVEEIVIRQGADGFKTFYVYSNQNLTVTYTSDNEDVVTVDEYGNLTEKAEGTATVTASVESGKSVSVVVRVVKNVEFVSVSELKNIEDHSYWDTIENYEITGTDFSKTVVTVNQVLNVNEQYRFCFDGLDLGGEEILGEMVNGEEIPGYYYITGNFVLDFARVRDDSGEYFVNNIRLLTFTTAGKYTFEFVVYNTSTSENVADREVSIIQINFTVE